MSGISFRQTANRVLMVRPCSFGFNAQTATNNAFQRRGFESGAQEVALREFDSFVALLCSHGMVVDVIEDTLNLIRRTPFFQTTGFPLIRTVLWCSIRCVRSIAVWSVNRL